MKAELSAISDVFTFSVTEAPSARGSSSQCNTEVGANLFILPAFISNEPLSFHSVFESSSILFANISSKDLFLPSAHLNTRAGEDLSC